MACGTKCVNATGCGFHRHSMSGVKFPYSHTRNTSRIRRKPTLQNAMKKIYINFVTSFTPNKKQQQLKTKPYHSKILWLPKKKPQLLKFLTSNLSTKPYNILSGGIVCNFEHVSSLACTEFVH